MQPARSGITGMGDGVVLIFERKGIGRTDCISSSSKRRDREPKGEADWFQGHYCNSLAHSEQAEQLFLSENWNTERKEDCLVRSNLFGYSWLSVRGAPAHYPAHLPICFLLYISPIQSEEKLEIPKPERESMASAASAISVQFVQTQRNNLASSTRHFQVKSKAFFGGRLQSTSSLCEFKCRPRYASFAVKPQKMVCVNSTANVSAWWINIGLEKLLEKKIGISWFLCVVWFLGGRAGAASRSHNQVLLWYWYRRWSCRSACDWPLWWCCA